MNRKYNYPKCEKREIIEEYFGIQIKDEYRWLENANDEEVLAWVAKENAYTDAFFDQSELENKIKHLKAIAPKAKYTSIQTCKDGYYVCKNENGKTSVYHTDTNFENEVCVLQKGDIENFSIYSVEPCPMDENYMIVYGGYAKDNKPSYVLLNAQTKAVVKSFPSVWAGAFSKKAKIFYYGDSIPNADTKDGVTTIRAYHIEEDRDEVIFEDFKNATLPVLHMASDGKTLMVEMWDNFVQFRFVGIDTETNTAYEINPEAKQMNYIDSMHGKHYFISKEESERGEIIAISEDVEVVLETSEHVLESAFFLNDTLYAITMYNAANKLLCIKDKAFKEVKMPADICTIGLLSKEKDHVLLTFESFNDAFSVLHFDGSEIKMMYSATTITCDDMVVEQRWAKSKEDKENIPYFIVYKEGTKLDGNNPVLVYAYGGYNSAMTPWYQDMVCNVIVPDWVNNGGVYVIITLRGGSEFGSKWHEAGMLNKKKNCYYDFIGVCEQIISDGWTTPQKLAINGCSNGGLLMSTLITMRPDLWGCVINSVPHTDMLHFVEDDNGPRYITEYGNPLESKEMLEYMLSYSPYHNVKEVAYPPMYLQSGECDNNVPPYHAKKFAARMQDKNTSDNPLLFRMLKDGAHDRGSGDAYWQTIAEIALFLEKTVKM